MRTTAFKLTAAVTLLIAGVTTARAQQDNINVVTTAVPFLRISPDARSGGMGDLGLATSPDASSSYFNLGKVAFNELPSGVNLTYTPWLKKLVNDVYMASMAGFYRFDELQAISGSLRYFSLGSIQFTDQYGQLQGEGRPHEFGVDIGYSRKLSDRTGLGVGLKYINSSLAKGATSANGNYKTGHAIAADLGFFHNRQDENGQGWAFGAALSNLGSKISYTDNADQKDFIPANLGIGTTYSHVIDESNKLSFGVDLNKLMVPTPPESSDTADFINYRQEGVMGSWFKSFGDAPGGMEEEFREFTVSVGAEYWYNNQFALRAGYFYEDRTKGNRRFFTAGAGIKYNVFGLNFSYLVPSGGSGSNQNPLSNTLRFSLIFDIEGSGSGE